MFNPNSYSVSKVIKTALGQQLNSHTGGCEIKTLGKQTNHIWGMKWQFHTDCCQGTQRRASNVLRTLTASSLLTLPSPLHPASSPYITSEQARRRDGNTQSSLFQPRHVTARLEGQKQRRHVSVRTPVASVCLETWLALPGQLEKPCQADVEYQLGSRGTGRFATAFCVPSQSVFSVSSRVTPTTDLCILFLLAVSNLSPGSLSSSSRLYKLDHGHVQPSCDAATHRHNLPL